MQPATNFHEKKSQAKQKEVDLVEQSKTIDERSQRLSALVAKIQMDDISSEEEELEKSDNSDTTFAIKSVNSDSEFY